MQTKQKSIETFKKYMDDLISSSFVLYEKKLTDLMRAISTSKLFFTLFEFCTDGFDYEANFQQCFQKGERYGEGRFILPKDNKDQIAFIFSLLYQINAKEVTFINLLEQYFYVHNYNESYRNFSMQVLVPFRAEVLRAVEAMAEDDYITNKAVIIEPKKAALKEDDLENIIKLLDESRSVILQYKIDPNLKGELIDLYNGFKESLYDQDAEKIRLAFLGYKYSTLYHRKQDVAVWKIENILKTNGVLQK